MGPKIKWPTINITAARYNTNEGQKPACILVKIANASKAIPNQRRYFITKVNHFINVKNLDGKDRVKKITNRE